MADVKGVSVSSSLEPFSPCTDAQWRLATFEAYSLTKWERDKMPKMPVLASDGPTFLPHGTGALRNWPYRPGKGNRHLGFNIHK